jgi:hypothetical protein
MTSRTRPDRDQAAAQVHKGAWGVQMSIVDKLSAEYGVAQDGELSATTSICVGLVVALAIYVIGSALLLQKFSASAPQSEAQAEMSFLGP